MVNPLTKKLFRDLWRIKGQALAIALVIAAGIAMYVMSLGTLHALDDTRDAYYERYRFADVFANFKRAPRSITREIAAIPGVRAVEGRIQQGATLDIEGVSEPASALMLSWPERARLNSLHVREGRLLSPDRAGEVMISEAFAQANDFHPGSRFDAILGGHKKTLSVVGVVLSPEYIYTLGPGALMPDDKRFGVMWLGEDAMEAAFDMNGAINAVSLSLERGANMGDVMAAVDRVLAPYGGLGAYGRADQISHWFISNEIEQLKTMGYFVPPVFLGIAAFLLSIVTIRLVDTEREQIGLLKAFGYSDAQVAVLYLKLVLLISALGVVIGFGFGTWLARGMTTIYGEYFRFPFLFYSLEPQVYATAATTGLVVAVLGALVSVRRAARLMPAVAMAPPPPTSYRPALIEGVIGLKGLSETARMVLRHTLRWPLRSGLTTLGIAMAVATLIGTSFFLDAMNEMIRVQFFEVQRHNVMILFSESEPESAFEEIERLPGVLKAEPFRALPVELSFGHRDKDTAIVALRQGADLFRVLDRDLVPVALPPHGLAVSAKLADILRVGLGDRITVRIKEGRRQTLQLPVTQIIKEYIEAPIYMDLAAMNRAVGDAPAVNGAAIQLDPVYRDELYRALKNTPQVGSIVLQTVLLQSFRDNIEKNFGLMVTFNIGFACVIAFGVVYNAARISLSERARELASLRVLGFTRAEVSSILLGELVLLTIVALPLGAWLGYIQASLWVDALDTELFRIPLVIDRATYGASMLTVAAAVAISSMMVRNRIDELDLVSALKTRE